MGARKLKGWLQTALGLGLLAWLLHSISWEQLYTTLTRAHPAWVLGAILIVIVHTVASAWRWQVLLQIALGERLPLLPLTRYYFISGFFNNFLPANIAGDLMRAGTLFKQGHDKVAASSTVIAERILNLASLCLLAVWALLYGGLPIGLGGTPIVAGTIVTGGVAGAAALAALWLRPPARLKGLVGQVDATVKQYLRAPSLVGGAIAMTMGIHLMLMLVTYCTFRSVGLDLSLRINLVVYAIAALALALPLTIQGIGVREGVYVGLLALVGVARETTLAALTINYFIVVLMSLSGALLYWSSLYLSRREAATAPARASCETTLERAE